MQPQLPYWTLPLCGGVFGAIIGSFLATLVLRWPAGRSVIDGRSQCDGCGGTLSGIDLIPLASFAVHRGRARCCGTQIEPLHPVTEGLAAIVGAVAFSIAEPPAALAGAVLGWMLLPLALLDWRHFWLPERLTIGLALTGLAFGWAGIGPDFSDRLIGGIAGFVSFEAIRLGYRALRHRDGMGGGDVRLFGAIGTWLGWRTLPSVLLVASMTGLLWCAILFARRTPVGKVQFGAFLALAAWFTWVAAQSPALSLLLSGAIGP